MSLPPVPPEPPDGTEPPRGGGFGPPYEGYGPSPWDEPGQAWSGQSPRRGRGSKFALLAVPLAAAAVLAVVLMASGHDVSTDKKGPENGSTATSPSPRTSFSLPTELPSRLPSRLPTGFPSRLPTGLPSRLPTGLPSGLPSALPSDLKTLLPSLSDELP